jgi:hypothetical protein
MRIRTILQKGGLATKGVNSRRNFSNVAEYFNRKDKTIQKNRAAMFSDSRDFDFLKDEVAVRLYERLDVNMERIFKYQFLTGFNNP